MRACSCARREAKRERCGLDWRAGRVKGRASSAASRLDEEDEVDDEGEEEEGERCDDGGGDQFEADGEPGSGTATT